MNVRLLDLLRCIECHRALELDVGALEPSGDSPDVWEGLLHCEKDHWFPIVRGIPRMLAGAIHEYGDDIRPYGGEWRWRREGASAGQPRPHPQRLRYDSRTRDNFNSEWRQFDLSDRTWGMDLDLRVQCYFVEPLRLAPHELAGRVVLDAGCGNGTQSVAYTELGVEVIAVDLSSGLEHGQAYRRLRPGAHPDRVHFIQADLRALPLDVASVDIIHSAGVLHHTPDTERTFRLLRPLLRPGGTFYVWLYRYEPGVTPLVNSIRRVTTRMSTRNFERLARRMATPFQLFCKAANGLGLRSYPALNHREAALALTDIFGAPHAHYHSYEEVVDWYRSEGFHEVWPCNESRRGFGTCGRLPASLHADAAARESQVEEGNRMPGPR